MITSNDTKKFKYLVLKVDAETYTDRFAMLN